MKPCSFCEPASGTVRLRILGLDAFLAAAGGGVPARYLPTWVSRREAAFAGGTVSDTVAGPG
jgi:hypothetical protein